MPQIHGHCDDRFTAVRDAFTANFAERDELGAAVTVLLDGAPVVDLWGGWADGARTRPWERDTVVNVWSTTKGPTALCAHLWSTADSSTWTPRSRTTGPNSRPRERSPYAYVTSSRTARASRACANRTPWPSSTTGN